MAFDLIDLPYEKTALNPAISEETLNYHHGKHHKAYIDKTNKAIEDKSTSDDSLIAVIKSARGSDQGLFNNSAQSWNHGFYWHSLASEETAASDELTSMIKSAFGSVDELKDKLKERGAGHFASGWVWLAEKNGELTIMETHDGDTLADQEGINPLLTIDLWEHAYYLDHQNARPEYLEQVTDKLNWSFASENLARGTTWEYPG
ncbi:superoxide dismutase [Erythrobacter litoralis]|uniref:superoxide dismutase n=1 Tax=Erythrobacter litoralis TaxID=39960 RepID=UPI0024351F53|nr:superoxide dismutase [Erythrobacter litoralis]MDG6077944.1 superoxide dismutase [Erythrobacter litoralis]